MRNDILSCLSDGWTKLYLMLTGHVGAPLPCNSIKLVDVSEMNYLAVNGEGEVKHKHASCGFYISYKCMPFITDCVCVLVSRCVWRVLMCSRVIWRTQRRLRRLLMQMDGFTLETLENGFRYIKLCCLISTSLFFISMLQIFISPEMNYIQLDS